MNSTNNTVIGKDVKFERIRRITWIGYLVGTLDRFNNGKKAEEKDRVKHKIGGGNMEEEKIVEETVEEVVEEQPIEEAVEEVKEGE